MIDSRVEALLRELDRQGVTGVCTRCPVCERPGKFSVTFRDGLALYCCHRASCGVRGVYAIAGNGERRKAPAFTPRPLTAPFVMPPMDSYWARYLDSHGVVDLDRWCLDTGFRVLGHATDTCVWPIKNLEYRLLGHQTRTPDKRVTPWMISDAPRYGWWPGIDSPTLLIVEDAMSAALYPGPAIALLGTHLSREVAAEFARLLPRADYRVALDPDALAVSNKVVERLRAYGLKSRVLTISRDVKDMTATERLFLFRSFD